MIDPRSTRAYKLEKENRELKKEIELLRNGNDITKIINDNVVFLKYQRAQQEKINELYSDLKTLWIVLWNMDTEMTSYQNEVYDKYYDEFHKE